MGRYYQGDIEGKFWFGCQSSDDGEFFGAKEEESNMVDYRISQKNIDEVHIGIAKCKEALGKYLILFDLAYNGGLDKHSEWAKLNENEQRELYEWFARLDIGMRILVHFITNQGEDCYFSAEF